MLTLFYFKNIYYQLSDYFFDLFMKLVSLFIIEHHSKLSFITSILKRGRHTRMCYLGLTNIPSKFAFSSSYSVF